MVRPTTYDRDAVLEAAMHAFWDQGYDATSMSELVSQTGLNPGSLYAAFGNKRALYESALERYQAISVQQFEEILGSELPPLQRIQHFYMAYVVEGCDQDADQKGCLLLRALMDNTCKDGELHQVVTQTFKTLEEQFTDVVKAGQAQGSIRDNIDAAELAALLTAHVYGLRSDYRVHKSSDRLKQMVDTLLEHISADPK